MSSSNTKYMGLVMGKDSRPISYIIDSMNNYRFNNNYDKICIVEGKTDEQFYSYANIKNMDPNKTKFIYNSKNSFSGEEPAVGKEAVLRTAQYVTNNLKHEINKYIFIVDRDFDGLFFEKVQLSEYQKSLITVLPCYSFENFFLYKNNIDKIFKHIFNNENILLDFNNLYYQFINEIIEYYALKSVFAACRNRKAMRHLKLNYSKSNSDEDIFKFNFNKKTYFKIDYMICENNKMKKEVERYEETHSYFKRQYDKLSKNHYLIKGKILFTFMTDYIYQKHNIKIDNKNEEKYISIVKKIDVDLKIKNIQRRR